MELFKDKAPLSKSPPLAERMRPSSLDKFMGQEKLLSQGKFLKTIIEKGKCPSLILWGPPGCGKTTLARIIAQSTDSDFVSFSAVLSGVKEIRDVIKRAEINIYRGKKTILFVDEIHRFNKAQQDAFLHHVEKNTITLIGATTENPSFEIISPLLSRCKVIMLEPLKKEHIKTLIENALEDHERGFGQSNVNVDKEAIDFIAEFSHGDARIALNTLEDAMIMTQPQGIELITLDAAKEAMQKKTLLYDKNREEHYNVISAFIKSMRGSDPDAALYWLARMVEAGEDPLFIARRMVIFASEDISTADPIALMLAISVKEAVDFVGMPEGWIPLAQGAAYLSTAPKSNASYSAYLEAKEDVVKFGALPVPLHLRNAPTSLMKEFGYGKGYKYPHNYKNRAGLADETYMPEELKGKKYYKGHDKK